MRWFLLCVPILSLLWTGTLRAEGPLRLEQVLEEALKNNPEILAMQEQILSAEERISPAGALPDPQVGAMFNGIPGRMMPDTRYDQTRITASQMFPLFGKLQVKREVASKGVEVVRAKYEEKRRSIVAQVKFAYYALFLAHKAIDINRENAELMRTFTRIAEAKYTVGKAPQQNVLKAQVSFSVLLNQLITLEQQLETARARLNELLNRSPETPLEEPGAFENIFSNRSLKELKTLALEHRPELQAMTHAIEQKEVLLNLAQKQYFPDLMAGMQYWQNNARKDQIAATVSINLPLWWRSKQDHGVKQAAADIQVAKSDYLAMKNQVLFQIQDRLVKVQTAERTIDLYRTSILPQAEQALEAARIGYETERVDFLTLVDSQKQLYTLRLEYYRAMVDHEQQMAGLEQAVGTDLR
ncbi:MAG: TolC family protein [Candidatus Latescibacterota bacterium]